MRQITYIPQLCNEAGELIFQGKIILNALKYAERMNLIKDVNFKVKENSVELNTDQIDSIVKIIEVAEKHVVSVDLIRLSDQVEFKCFDDLSYDKDGSLLINELGNVILSGVKLGKQ